MGSGNSKISNSNDPNLYVNAVIPDEVKSALDGQVRLYIKDQTRQFTTPIDEKEILGHLEYKNDYVPYREIVTTEGGFDGGYNIGVKIQWVKRVKKMNMDYVRLLLDLSPSKDSKKENTGSKTYRGDSWLQDNLTLKV